MGTVPQVSQCAAKMAGLLGRRRLGGTPRPTSRSFLTICTISLDGVGVLPSRRVWVPLTRGFGFPHGDFDSPCRASVFPCGGWRPSLRRLASSPVPGFGFPCTGGRESVYQRTGCPLSQCLPTDKMSVVPVCRQDGGFPRRRRLGGTPRPTTKSRQPQPFPQRARCPLSQ